MAMVRRMIGEIENYLSLPMRDASDWWEQEERIYLCDLLAELSAEMNRAGAGSDPRTA